MLQSQVASVWWCRKDCQCLIEKLLLLGTVKMARYDMTPCTCAANSQELYTCGQTDTYMSVQQSQLLTKMLGQAEHRLAKGCTVAFLHLRLVVAVGQAQVQHVREVSGHNNKLAAVFPPLAARYRQCHVGLST